MKVITNVRVIEPGEKPQPEPYRVKGSTIIWFMVTVLSLLVIQFV